MKRFVGLSLCAALIASPAFALPPIPKYLLEIVKDDADSKKFADMYAELEMKCSVCHIPKADKKAKGHGLNDFGKVVHDNLNHKAFMAADKEKMTDEAKKLLKEGWTKSLEAKNAAGETYGSLVKEGKIPGKNN